jgi:2-methylcitrate dehydratase PrpD
MLAKKLGALISETQYNDLPCKTIEMAKLRVLDYLGISISGYKLGLYKNVMDVLNIDQGQSIIYGEGYKTSMRNAIVINGFMAHSSYYEDGSRTTGGHPSTAIMPALIALGEERRFSGKQLLLSMVVGYDIFNRIGSTMYPSAVNRGFQTTPILAPIATAGACAKMMNLNEEQTIQALNISAPLGAGLKVALKEAITQPIQVSRSCEGGLVAALLAEHDLVGYNRNLEFFITSHAGNVEKQVDLTTWGEKFEIENSYIKIHAGCRGNHAPLDVILDIIKKNNIDINEILSIKVFIDNVTAANEIHNPQNKNEAQFNIPFSVAVALLKGNASLFQYTEDNLKDSTIIEMMNKVIVEIDSDLDKLLPDKRGARGEIILKSGEMFNSFIDIPLGEPENPLSSDQIIEKFDLLTKDVLGTKIENIKNIVLNLDSLSSIDELTKFLKVN